MHAQTFQGTRKHNLHRRGAAEAGTIDIAAPDLPARVSISSSDLSPGDIARKTLLSIAADPSRILDSYAPIGTSKTASIRLQRAPVEVRPATLTPIDTPVKMLDSEPAMASISGVSAPALATATPAPVVTLASVPEKAPAVPVVSPVAPKPADPATAAPPVAATPQASTRAPTPQASAPTVSPPPAEVTSVPGAAVVFDVASLQKAIDVYVGAEPLAVAGRIPAAEQARYTERQAVRAFYAARSFAPLWIENGAFNAPARSVLRRIDHAAEDGLDLHALGVSPPQAGDGDALAASELAVTEAAAAYGRQASGGRVDPARIGDLIAVKPDVADAAKVLTALAGAPDAGEALRAFNPSQKGYGALRAKLAELRQSGDASARTIVPYGPTLKTGMKDARVPLIRARFGLDMALGESAAANLVYDIKVASAVADFQKAHHMPASGVLTIRTVAALSSGGDPRRLEDEIVANMERWRWLPRDMGQNRIEVNVPDFTVNVMHGDEVFHQARVVVGKPDKPTPIFSETMRFIIVNPYWNVPLSIVKKEMMPKLAADRNYFANHGYETVERDGQIYVRQPPGDSNALGRIKFMFPNQYSVYLHDTNARALFGNDRRALSHGCVRVEDPFKFAEAVLGQENGWTEARVKRLIGGNERTINLPQPMPIHIVYFTAFVDDAGALQLRDDVYGYSEKLKAAMGLGRSGQIAVN